MGGCRQVRLGHLLELLHTSQTKWRTLSAEGSEWRDPPLLTEAFIRTMPARGDLLSQDEPSYEAQSLEQWRLWIRRPSTYRTTFAVGGDEVTAVIDGDWWWSVSQSMGARTNGGRANHSHGLGPGEPLFSFKTALAALQLEEWSEAEFAERSAARLTARPLPAEERTPYDDGDYHAISRLHGIGAGADEFELMVDAERGVILRCEARLGGKPFRILEVKTIRFDETFADDTFRLTPPGGDSFTTV